MLREHGDFQGGRVRLEYIGKGNAQISTDFYSPRLATALVACQDLPSAEIISWQDDAGTPHAVWSEQINETLQLICRVSVTAKTMPTRNGTLATFNVAPAPGDLTIKAMTESAGETLHNTPTVARNSYVHPSAIELEELESDPRAAIFDRLRDVKSGPRLRSGWDLKKLHSLDWLKTHRAILEEASTECAISHDAVLQSDEVAGNDEVPDLRAAIKRRLLAQDHATQSSEQLQIVGPFDQQRRSSFNDQLTDLEILHHLDVLIGHRLENGVSAQRTLAACGPYWSSLSGCLGKMTRHRKTGSARAGRVRIGRSCLE